MNKKGQISLYVIIGIVIISAISITIYMVKKSTKEVIPPELIPVKEYAQECIKQKSQEALLIAGQMAGYTRLLPKHFSQDNITTNYLYFYNPQLISLDDIENEIASYIDNSLECNFSLFKNFEINVKKPKSKVIAGMNITKIEVNWPITAKKGDLKAFLKKFEVELPVRLNIIYYFTLDIITRYLTNSSLCLTCITEKGKNLNIYTNIDLYENNDILFTLIDYDSMLNNTEYKFKFAVKAKLK